MNRRQVWVAVVASIALACGAWVPNLALAAEAPEPAKAPAPKPEEVQEAVKGFKGFLVGRVVSHNDTGIVLKVKAVTLIEGCQAKNPGILLGLETPVRLATEKGEDGKERPAKALADAVKNIEKMPAIAFGGFGGGNAVVVMGGAAGGGADAAGVRVQTTRTMTMNINGAQIQIGGGPEGADQAKGPVATARVVAAEDGTLVVDRVAPGCMPVASWDAMPTFQFLAPGQPGAPVLPGMPVPEPEQPPVPKEPKDAQF